MARAGERTSTSVASRACCSDDASLAASAAASLRSPATAAAAWLAATWHSRLSTISRSSRTSRVVRDSSQLCTRSARRKRAPPSASADELRSVEARDRPEKASSIEAASAAASADWLGLALPADPLEPIGDTMADVERLRAGEANGTKPPRSHGRDAVRIKALYPRRRERCTLKRGQVGARAGRQARRAAGKTTEAEIVAKVRSVAHGLY